ncbi:putative hydro-lyase KRH_21160 [Pogoniulus pusillus]|uniref:putative hydro-lyase KRH_21160 n=1 Tax=Pogoniulus pusillus TaxID=488313 RepID=UPI0030B924E5
MGPQPGSTTEVAAPCSQGTGGPPPAGGRGRGGRIRARPPASRPPGSRRERAPAPGGAEWRRCRCRPGWVGAERGAPQARCETKE